MSQTNPDFSIFAHQCVVDSAKAEVVVWIRLCQVVKKQFYDGKIALEAVVFQRRPAVFVWETGKLRIL
jgi:hypothetical protein